MDGILSKIGMISVFFILLFLIFKIYQHYDNDEISVYKFEEEDDEDL